MEIADQVSNETTETNEVAETPPKEEQHPTFDLPIDHPAIKALTQARQEAAGNRVKKNKAQDDLEVKARQWDDYQKTQMTEMERLAAEKTAMETELSTMKTENLRQKILNKYKLEAKYEVLLAGDESEMEEKAKILAEGLAGTQKEDEKIHPALLSGGGDRVRPVVKGNDSASAGSEWLRKNFFN